jgi:hypothetical protein
MKKLILLFFLFSIGTIRPVNAQVFSPQLVGHYGTGFIYYSYGYYHGNVSNGIAHGVGTFYFSDGSFYYGGFAHGFWHGEGVIVSPYHGYLTGCWSSGNYTGQCSTSSKYNSQRNVERVVYDVSSKRSDDSRYTSISPEGYTIKRIDSDTQMGRRLLGQYSGN